jgi:hypothetical protein
MNFGANDPDPDCVRWYYSATARTSAAGVALQHDDELARSMRVFLHVVTPVVRAHLTFRVADAARDIPGKNDLVRFCDGDSLLLESIYRRALNVIYSHAPVLSTSMRKS